MSDVVVYLKKKLEKTEERRQHYLKRVLDERVILVAKIEDLDRVFSLGCYWQGAQGIADAALKLRDRVQDLSSAENDKSKLEDEIKEYLIYLQGRE